MFRMYRCDAVVLWRELQQKMSTSRRNMKEMRTVSGIEHSSETALVRHPSAMKTEQLGTLLKFPYDDV